MTATATAIALVVVCLLAAGFDVSEGRIPNLLTVSGLIVALLLRAPEGFGAVGGGLGGAGIAMAVALPFFLAGGLGGGDVKLLAAVGAFMGVSRVWEALFWIAVLGGAMALPLMVFRRRTRETLLNLQILIKTLGRRTFTGWKSGADNQASLTLDDPDALSLPYALAIGAGSLVTWFLA